MSELKILHLAPHARGFGGIELLLERHVGIDAALGFRARQIGLFDRPERRNGDFQAMGFGGTHTPRAMRRALANACSEWRESFIVWHNAWGLPWFAGADRSRRRVACLHLDRGDFESWLPGLREHLDGVLTVSPGGAATATELLPGFPRERIACLPIAIEPPAQASLARATRDTWLIGCAGRLVREQKRWDRLVPFVAELRRLGVKFRLEIVGDGKLRPWLEQQFRGDEAVSFLGVLPKETYWQRLRDWDAAVFFSDAEGGPQVLLEAMAMGALPVYPNIGCSLGDVYVPQLDPRLYYRAGDAGAAARGLREVMTALAGERARLRDRARALVVGHRPDAYAKVYGEFVRAIDALPRLSREGNACRRRQWTDVLPLGLITRMAPQALWR